MEAEGEDSIFNVFIDMMRASMPDKVITNFIFVAEVVGNANNELSVVSSNGMTPWLAQGMLNAAQDIMLSGMDSMGFGDELSEDE